MKKDYQEEIESITEDIVEMFTATGFDVKVQNRLYHQKNMQINFYYYQFKAFITFNTRKLDKEITTEKIIKEKNWQVTIITDETEIISEKYRLDKLLELILSEKVYRKIVKNESVNVERKEMPEKSEPLQKRSKREVPEEALQNNITIQKYKKDLMMYVYQKKVDGKMIQRRFPLTPEGLQAAIEFSKNPEHIKTLTGIKYLQVWENNNGRKYYKCAKKYYQAKLYPFNDEGKQQAIEYINEKFM